VKTLIIALLLTLAPALDAQERLDPVWLTLDLDHVAATYPDGECTQLSTQGGMHGQHFISYGLTDTINEPETVGFIVRGEVEFFAYSEFLEQNFWTMGYAKPSADYSLITFKYARQPGRSIKNVGIALRPFTSDFRTHNGSICVDAAFVWYPRADVNGQPLQQAEQQRIRDSINTHPCEWRSVTGALLYTNTALEIEELKPQMWLQGPEGFFWNGRFICYRKGRSAMEVAR
jgi:hypothetical protein